MQSVILYHTDPTRNMRRFYRLDIQPDLFGNHCLMRVYGRIGCSGQMRSIPYSTLDDAEIAFCKLRVTKEKRGYTA